jgi:hypothetical protein
VLKLFGHDASPFVRRVRVVLAELQIPFERDPHGWQDPAAEFVAASPIQRVPMLDLGPGSPVRHVFESRVIAGCSTPSLIHRRRVTRGSRTRSSIRRSRCSIRT